jgi:hypothetical protein
MPRPFVSLLFHSPIHDLAYRRHGEYAQLAEVRYTASRKSDSVERAVASTSGSCILAFGAAVEFTDDSSGHPEV